MNNLIGKKRQMIEYLCSFFLPIVLLLIIMILVHVFPFGDNTVAVNDMKNQYLSLMTYFKNNIVRPRNFMYSYQIGLGGNFFAAFAYYLANPINFLACLFPSSMIPLFFMLNTLLNVGLIGLTTYTFLKNSIWLNQNDDSKQNKFFWCLVLSLSFTFSAFITNYQLCVMWINAVVLFPLVLLGLDRVLYSSRQSTWLYWVSLAALILINWYIGIIVLLFLFVLMIFWTISLFLQARFVEWLKKGFKVFLLTFLSVGIGAIWLIPSYLNQQTVDQQPFKFNYHSVYQISGLFHSILTGNISKFTNPQVVPQVPLVFCGVIPILLLFLFLMNSKIQLRDRFLSILFVVFLMCSTYYMGFYMIWHALTIPNGFSQRESFVISMVLICLAYKGTCVFYQKYSSLKVGIASIVTLIIAIATSYFSKFSSNEWIELVCLLFLVFVSSLMISSRSLKWIGISILSLGIFYNLWNYNYHIDLAHFTNMSNRSYEDVVNNYEQAVKYIHSHDKSFYRIGSNAELTANDPFTYNYNGVQAYISQQPTSMTDYISALGYFQKHAWYRWNTFNNGSTDAINRMLGIKYFLLSSPKILKETQKINSMDTWNTGLNIPSIKLVKRLKNIDIYQNKNAFPLIFNISPNALTDTYQYNPQSNPFDYFNWILASIEGHYDWIYTKQYVKQMNLKSRKNINYHVTTSANGNVYLYLAHPQPTPLVSSNVSQFIVNGVNKGEYGGRNFNGENGILYLGKFHKGELLNITLKNGKLLHQPLRLFVAVENPQKVDRLYNFALNRCINHLTVDGDWIKFRTDSNFKGGYLGLSIPFDQSWSARIDKRRESVVRALGDLTAVKVPSGSHRIRMKFNVPGLKVGVIISITSLIILLAYEAIKMKVKH